MTGFGRGARERAQYEKFFYPGTDVLINKLDIRDTQDLERAERMLSAKRAAQGPPDHALQLTYDSYKGIHHHLFQDLYDWAGKERTYTTGRNAAPFATPENIHPWMENQFTNLKAENFLRDLNRNAFAYRAAHYCTEINACHPFIDGNGRTLREWLANLADQAGYEFLMQPQDQTAWYEASRVGFVDGDTQPMARLILDQLIEIHT